jgi:hypothetical protein
MENKEQILEEQIKALKELIAIKDQVIQALRAQQPLIISYPAVTYPQWQPYVGGPTSGTLTVKDGSILGTTFTSGYVSTNSNSSNVTNIKGKL